MERRNAEQADQDKNTTGKNATGKSASAVTIGNFDGVHRGHRALLAKTVQCAQIRSVAGEPTAATVLTFNPHPSLFLRGVDPPRLQTLPRKVASLTEAGIEAIVVRAFNEEVASMSPDQFVDEILCAELRARDVIVGSNFRFGNKRIGDVSTLRELGQSRGFVVHEVPLLDDGRAQISSSQIRAAIQKGEPYGYALGRLHQISGIIVHGFARGRTIGYPTANFAPREVLPPNGVYAVCNYLQEASGQLRFLGPGVMNLGVKPTLGDNHALLAESHIFDFQEDLYGQELVVELVSHLREERKFASFEALRAQIAEDDQAARRATRTHLESAAKEKATEGP
jgi:riboflavin kinase / FMN adenylyltransferase